MSYWEENINKEIDTPGGKLCQVFGKNEGANASVALVKMDKGESGVKHYHDIITEVYVFSKGKGKIIINGISNNVTTGDVFVIPHHNVHYILAEEDMEFVCICTPPWTEENEFELDENITKFENGIDVLEKKLGYGNLLEFGIKNLSRIDKFKLNNGEKFSLDFINRDNIRVYYFISGTGIIKIDGVKYKINQAECYKLEKNQIEEIISDGELEFIVVQDNF